MTKIKFCGLRRSEDAQAANQTMPDYAGFVFAQGKRQVTEETAARLREILSPDILTVGVFVNHSTEAIARLAGRGIIQLVQLHGEESPAYIRQLRGVCPLPIIRALPVAEFLPPVPDGIDYPLYDTACAQRGGSGKPFRWELLAATQSRPYFLAGGLSCFNVENAVTTLRPYCVDVSSGIETDGWKDPEKMKRFAEIVRRC